MLSIRKFQPSPPVLSIAFSLAVILAYLTINLLPFDSYSIAWDARQWWILLMYFTVSGAPFLAAGWAIGAALDNAGTEAYRPYAANMIGAAIGCPIALVSVDLLGGEGAIGLIIVLGLSAAIFLSASIQSTIPLGLLAILVLIAWTTPIKPLQLKLSPYKPLSTARLANDAELTVTDWGTTVRLDVIESPGLHTFPGLSLNTAASLPEQAGVFLDGEGPYPVTRLSPDDPLTTQISYRLPSTIAYSLRPTSEALLLDWGAGTPALFALSQPDINLWLPDQKPLLTDLLQRNYADFSFELLARGDVNVVDRTARGALADKKRTYDVIEFALSDMFRPVTSGAFSLGENYLLTVDAITDAWERLDADGILVITRWIGTPPNESARAWNTLLAALRLAGVEDIEQHVVAYRSMRTATMIASPRAFDCAELTALRQFLKQNAFDALVLPDLEPAEINRHNRLPQPVYHELFNALLKDPTAGDKYTFRLEPPRDDQPYFNHYFRWGQTPEILASLGLYWQPFGGSGYFVLLVLMALMILLACLLVGLSMLFLRNEDTLSRPGLKAMVYFAGLGSGYLLVEIPLIKQFTLLLDHPAGSLAGVLFVILLGSGIGSWLSPRINLRSALFALLGYLGLLTILVPATIHYFLPSPMLVRWSAMIMMLMPLGILMGVPFASGLRQLEHQHSGWIPWAWAVNGAFSGISGVAAAMISLDAGFQATLIAGWAAYLLALTTYAFTSSDPKLQETSS
jgi:hypothetical protein